MKTLYFILFTLLLGMFQPANAQKTAKAEKAARIEKAFQETRQLIESHYFKITVNHVYPQSGYDVSRFNPRGEIIINDSIAKGQLPYFGRAYSLSYGTRGGIEFDNVMKKQTMKVVEKRKKKYISYQFTITAQNDNYQFYIEIAPEGGCSISLTSNNRAHISYSGTVSALEEE